MFNKKIEFIISQAIVFFPFEMKKPCLIIILIKHLKRVFIRRITTILYQIYINLYQIQRNRNHIFSSIIISKKYVLVAEHYLENKETAQMAVIVKSMDLKRGKNYYVY
jgi:hypothetical protein